MVLSVRQFIEALYAKTLALAAKPYALWALALVAFVESSVFPIPPDIMLIPMVLAVRQRAWLLAGVCTLASVCGGYFGYLIGLVLFDLVGQPLIDFYGYQDKYQHFQTAYKDWGVMIVAFFGLTPFPYKAITIASGAVQMNLIAFGIASLIARGIRFFLIAWLLYRFGDPIKNFIERRLGILALLFCLLLIGGFAILKYGHF